MVFQIHQNPTPLLQWDITSEKTVLQMYWAAYTASGNVAYLDAIIDAAALGAALAATLAAALALDPELAAELAALTGDEPGVPGSPDVEPAE